MMILVPIDMPKNCGECLLSFSDDYGETGACGVLMDDVTEYDTTRQPNCPLIEFKEEE